MTRPVLFVSWSVRHGRSRDLAAALGAEPVYIGIRRRRRRWLAPFRYVASFLQTVVMLLRRRPGALFVMAPPLPLTLLAVAYGRIARASVAVDAHTGAVLAIRSGRPRRGLRLAARFADVTIVTNSALSEPLRAQGITTVTLHDAIPAVHDAPPDASAFHVVAPLSWAPDEPFDIIVAAAQLRPNVRFVATGRPPEAVTAGPALPANVELSGFVPAEEFDRLIAGAGVVLALTTRAATMQRAGYEAMAYGVPVIASDTEVLREFFADAALYVTTGDDLAAAVDDIAARRRFFVDAIAARRGVARAEFDAGLREIRSLMGLDAL